MDDFNGVYFSSRNLCLDVDGLTGVGRERGLPTTDTDPKDVYTQMEPSYRDF